MTLSADGEKLATGSEDGIIEILDMARRGNSVLTLKGHESTIHGIVFSPSGNKLATQCAYHIKIWNIRKAGGCMQTFKAKEINIETLFALPLPSWPMVFSADDSHFAYAKGDEIVRLHNLTEQTMSELQMEDVSCLVFSPDGLLLAAGDESGMLTTYDLKTEVMRQCTTDSLGSFESVNSIAFSSDGQLLAFSNTIGYIYVLEMPSAKCIFKLSTLYQVAQLSFSRDGKSFMTEQGRLTPESWFPHIDVQDADTEEDEPTEMQYITEGYGISFEGMFVTKDGEFLVWLPSEYRPRSRTDGRKHALVTGSVVMVLNRSGQLMMFGFDDKQD